MTETAPCQGVLFVLVGPSGVGKNETMKGVLAKVPRLRQFPTMTTRPMRVNEQQGVQHFFVSPEEFRRLIAEGALVEYQEVYKDKYYGTPRQHLQDTFDAASAVIADIEVVGADKVKAAFPDRVVTIFIAPPSLADLEKRIRHRGETEKISEEEIKERLDRAPFELSYARRCDYCVINDTLAQTVDAVTAIIVQELHRRGCA
ncbi:MAG: guanylate kinase [Anaerolineae bacterium]|nr:guanylate kinase [Anaerolineae bacterium]